MSRSNLSPGQIMQYVYDPTTEAIKSMPSGGQLVTEEFDYISASYPSATQEVYTYKSGGASGTVVATVTVDYTDGTKTNVSAVTKT